MATIFSTARQTSMMYQIANRGLAFGRLSNAPDSLWGARTNHSSRQNNYNALSSLYGNNGAQLRSLMKQYSSVKQQFGTETNKTITDLKKSSSALKTTDFNVKGATEAETDANIKNVVSKVSDFVGKYNDAAKFFSDNADVSRRIGQLADSFKDERPFTRSLSEVGITSDTATGKLRLDTDSLTSALKKSPKTVEAVLGKNGLAGRAEQKADRAAFQKENLFPNFSSLLGQKSIDPSKLTYSNRALAQQANYNHIGTLLNMYF